MSDMREPLREAACRISALRNDLKLHGCQEGAVWCLNIALSEFFSLMELVAPACGACAADYFTGFGGHEHDEFCELREAEEVVFSVKSLP